jgi:hypothetical protein
MIASRIPFDRPRMRTVTRRRHVRGVSAGAITLLFAATAYAQSPTAVPAGTTASSAQAPKEGTGSYTELAPLGGEELQFGFHGYFRAPAMVAISKRDASVPSDTGGYDYRSPRLVDNLFYQSGFAYLPVNETSWAELFLSAGNEHVTGTIAFASGDYTDSSSSGLFLPNGQKGLFQGFVTLRYQPRIENLLLRTQVKAGVFWERFGYLPRYDTYLVGRVHVTGVQALTETMLGQFDTGLTLGVGYHQSENPGNEGQTNLLYARWTGAWAKMLTAGLYYLYAFAQDKASTPTTPADSNEKVIGGELAADLQSLGSARAVLSTVTINDPGYSLSGAVELLSLPKPTSFTAYAGDTFTHAKTTNLALQADLSARRIAGALAGKDALPSGSSDVTLGVFSEYVRVNESDGTHPPLDNTDNNKQVWFGRQGRRYSKWGAELDIRLSAWCGASFRYDHVNLDVDIAGTDFDVLSPRLTLYPVLPFTSNALIYLQYSRYTYGSLMQTPFQQTQLSWFDRNVLKVQSQMTF